MSTLIPLTIWGKGGINPAKVHIILRSLSLPFTIIDTPLSAVKDPSYLAINPNGRLPSLRDPNNDDLTLWESGAIIEYLVERYDTAHLISYAAGSPNAQRCRQWLHFQTSGQGPYYGQASWFKKFHPERVPSALERYVGEMRRVTGVLETHLKEQQQKGKDGPWLVGDKCTYADLAFLTWQRIVSHVVLRSDGFDPGDFPVVEDWLRRMEEREAVREVMVDPLPTL